MLKHREANLILINVSANEPKRCAKFGILRLISAKAGRSLKFKSPEKHFGIIK